MVILDGNPNTHKYSYLWYFWVEHHRTCFDRGTEKSPAAQPHAIFIDPPSDGGWSKSQFATHVAIPHIGVRKSRSTANDGSIATH